MSTVKFIHSAMTGAPVLTGAAGTLIGVLDAALVNGFGSAVVDSLVVAGGIATVTRGAGHPFGVSEITRISGATVTGGTVNADHIVLTATPTQYTFAATGIPNQTATGTITHLVAPLGWTKPFSGTNLAAYRSPDVTGTQEYLRVNDTDARDARVVGYETMTDVNTGTGVFPTTVQLSGGGFWAKSNTVDAVARPWVVVGDARGFYLWTDPRSANTTGNTQSFGDFASRKSPDAYGCAITGLGAALLVAGSAFDVASSNRSSTTNHWASRGVSGLGGSQPLVRQALIALSGNSDRLSGATNVSASPAYPNPADNSLLVSQMALSEVSPNPNLRGTLPGFYWVINSVGDLVFANRDLITGVTGLSGRTLRALQNPSGVSFVDVTGPWAR
jgi:hypothetical protein